MGTQNTKNLLRELRELIDDTRKRRWTEDHQLMWALNRAAKNVFLFMVNHQQERNLFDQYSPVTVTTDGTNKEFTVAATNYFKLWRVLRTDTEKNEPTSYYKIRDEDLYTYGSGYDSEGRVLFTVNALTDDTINVIFPVVHKSGIVLSIDYVCKPPNLGQQPDNDPILQQAWEDMPATFQDLIVLYAARRLLSSDDAAYAGVREQYTELKSDVLRSLYKPELDEPFETYDPEEDFQHY